jgi:hypothetical protein
MEYNEILINTIIGLSIAFIILAIGILEERELKKRGR